MRTSLVYRSGRIYELVMRALYRRGYPDRYRSVAAWIPSGASVLDVCCGPGTLYREHLVRRDITYTGLDINQGFVTEILNDGGTAMRWDLHDPQPLPSADFVVMHASLYHFLPDAEPVVQRMLSAASQAVVVAEPIRNMATSQHRVIAAIGRRLTNAGTGQAPLRFTEASLDELFGAFADQVVATRTIAGGREKLYVLASGAEPVVEWRDA